MDRRNQLGTALIVLAVALFTLPALFPVQPVLSHDTRPGTFDTRDQLREQGIEIVAYENMSDRGQQLYVTTLEQGGEYRVPPGEGAPAFDYLTGEELREAYREGSVRRPGVVAIERPESTDLPQADEPSSGAERPDQPDGETRGQQAQRYDLMETSTGPPPLGSTAQLLRLGAALLAVISLGVGGYLRVSR